jgi:hypothetical protein
VPLIDGTDYQEILEMAGQARVEAPWSAGEHGARVVVGIGERARLRQQLAGLARGFAGKHDFALDFLGEWAMLGCEDRPALAETVVALDRNLPQPPVEEAHRDADSVAARTPAYAAIGIKSMAGATIALAALHALADDVAPGRVTWGEGGKEREVPFVRVAVAEDPDRRRGHDGAAKEEQVQIFYALTSGVFLIALRESTLRRQIDEVIDGHGPGPAAPGSGSQLVVDVSGDKQGAIFTVLSWLLTGETLDADAGSRALAEALLVGARDRAGDPAAMRALGIAYFGAAPVPGEGGVWTLGADGMRHPARGSASAPVWPAVPVAGGTIDRLLGAVGRFRSEIAFDREGPGQGKGSQALLSLHARVTLGLRGE